MGRVKSDNRLLGQVAGNYNRYRHSAVAETVTIPPAVGEFVVLERIVIGTTTASAIVVRSSVDGVILSLKASISEGTYTFNLPLKGSLIVENPGGSDLLVVFSNN